MDKKKKGNIFKSSVYSISTIFDKNYNIIMKASQVLNNMEEKKKKE